MIDRFYSDTDIFKQGVNNVERLNNSLDYKTTDFKRLQVFVFLLFPMDLTTTSSFQEKNKQTFIFRYNFSRIFLQLTQKHSSVCRVGVVLHVFDTKCTERIDQLIIACVVVSMSLLTEIIQFS